MKPAGLKVQAHSVTGTWATQRKHCHMLQHATTMSIYSMYTVYKYTHWRNSRVSGTPYLSACGSQIFSDLWPLSTGTALQRGMQRHSGRLCSQRLEKNHFKSCAPSSGLRHGAPPRLLPSCCLSSLWPSSFRLKLQAVYTFVLQQETGLLLSKKPAGDARQSAWVWPQRG